MIKILNKYIFKDLGWKLIALFSAFLLWFIVQNTENPNEKKTITKTLQLQNEDILQENGFAIMNRDALKVNVSMNIEAKRSDMSQIYNQSPNVRAFIDLKMFDGSYIGRLGEPIALAIGIEVPPSCIVRSKDPESAIIVIDKMAVKTLPVKVNVIGPAKDGFEDQQPVCTPKTVEITAPKSILDTVSTIEASVNVRNSEEDIIQKGIALNVYDQEHNNIINSVDVSDSKVDVTVPLYNIVSVPIQPKIEGIPKKGFRVKSVTVEPNTLDVVGTKEELLKMAAIRLDPVNLNGVSSNTKQVFDITKYLKDSEVKLKRNSSHEVTVTVDVEQEIVKEITLPINSIKLIRGDNTLNVQLTNIPVVFLVGGTSDVLNDLTEESIIAELNVSNLPVGTHMVSIDFTLPQNVSLVNGPILMQVTLYQEIVTTTTTVSTTTVSQETEELQGFENIDQITSSNDEITEQITVIPNETNTTEISLESENVPDAEVTGTFNNSDTNDSENIEFSND